MHYDAIIIGGGNGGLSIGATLAKKGKKVCLLERHNIPGGCGTSFRRGRFEFEVALHQLSSVGTEENPGPTRKIFEELGIMQQLDLFTLDSLYRVVLPNKVDVTMPTDPKEAIAELAKRFPQYTEEIKRFYQLVFSLFSEINVLQSTPPQDISKEKFPLYFKYALKTAQEVMDEFFEDKELQLCLNAYWSFMGTPPSIFPFTILAGNISVYMHFKPKYLKGGSQVISQALAEVIRQENGEVRFNCGAKKIVVKDGKAVGVVTEEDEELTADIIISNVSPSATYFDLMDKEDVPQAAVEYLSHYKPSISALTCFIGLDCPPETVGIKESMNIFYKSADVNQGFKNASVLEVSDDPVVFTCYTIDDPTVSPEGTSIITAGCIKYGKPWIELAPEKYYETKYKGADAIIERLEENYPGIRSHIEEISVATPLTHMRYLNTPEGCVYGYEQDLKATGMFYPNQSLMPNLEFVGGFAGLCGFSPNYIQGYKKAHEILMKYSKEDK
ncbi:phytoene desaturase family protein [Clostridium grantii]|uniref:Prolycopene isomerase n=1 Tax=Clostridium grantii DSM 8605 TaxID=1121316 RepID=A0A1M5XNI7_9CLOT|nr:NAD(P)/FAD-dependent oxidoreductase [Clostridium grantii]SHI01114.1 prolycopene isomerase [Clostridium grantii DSM 8605]